MVTVLVFIIHCKDSVSLWQENVRLAELLRNTLRNDSADKDFAKTRFYFGICQMWVIQVDLVLPGRPKVVLKEPSKNIK